MGAVWYCISKNPDYHQRDFDAFSPQGHGMPRPSGL